MKSMTRLPAILAVLVLIALIAGCDMGIRDVPVSYNRRGDPIIFHHATSAKVFIYSVDCPVDGDIFFEGGLARHPAGGRAFSMPQLQPGEELNGHDIFIPLQSFLARMFGTGGNAGLVINPNNAARTGNDPSASLHVIPGGIPGHISGQEAVMVLCEEILIINENWTTYRVREIPAPNDFSFTITVRRNIGRGVIVPTPTHLIRDGLVEHELRPMLVDGVWFINVWGLENWLPNNARNQFSPGRPSPIHGFESEAINNVFVTIMATHEPIPPQRLPSPDGITMDNINDQHRSFYNTRRAIEIAENFVQFQRPSGGWFKNFDMVNMSDLPDLPPGMEHEYFVTNWSTLDNDATHVQLQFLARVISSGVDDQRFLESFFRGLAFVLRVQHPSGSWPQFAEPARPGYWSEATFNDEAIPETLNLLEDIYQRECHMAFVHRYPEVIQAVTRARNMGIEFILRSQLRTRGCQERGLPGGELTVWAQQHNPITLLPAHGRSFELPVLVSMESAAVLQYLMRLPNPSDRVIRSIESGMNWFRRTAMMGYRTYRHYCQTFIRGSVRMLSWTGNSRDMVWARFYDLETGDEMLFTTRDGRRRWHYLEVPEWDRAGYQYVTDWPLRIFPQFAEWQRRRPDTSFPLDNGMPELTWEGMPPDLEIFR